MFYRDRIASLRTQAEASFRNYEGTHGQRSYRHADGAAAAAPVAQETLDSNDRTWTITVTNSSSAASTTAYVFGAVKDLTDTLNTGCTVVPAEATHLQIKTEILGQPVRILGLKMTCVSATQFSNVISIHDTKSTGGDTIRLFQPLNYRSAQNQLTTQIDAPSFELLVTPTVWFSFTLNKAEVVTFMFTIIQKTLLHNTLSGTAVVASSNRPAPTGLPQIDMPRGV